MKRTVNNDKTILKTFQTHSYCLHFSLSVCIINGKKKAVERENIYDLP